jgi:hypothetical protein
MADKDLLSRISALRTFLVSADGGEQGSFAEVFSAFLDITEGTNLFRESKPTRDAVVAATLQRVAREAVDDDSATLERLAMVSFRPAGIVHGGFAVSGLMGTFFFFPKEGMGLLALNGGGPLTQYCRITSTELPPGTVPMRRPTGTH